MRLRPAALIGLVIHQKDVTVELTTNGKANDLSIDNIFYLVNNFKILEKEFGTGQNFRIERGGRNKDLLRLALRIPIEKNNPWDTENLADNALTFIIESVTSSQIAQIPEGTNEIITNGQSTEYDTVRCFRFISWKDTSQPINDMTDLVSSEKIFFIYENTKCSPPQKSHFSFPHTTRSFTMDRMLTTFCLCLQATTPIPSS